MIFIPHIIYSLTIIIYLIQAGTFIANHYELTYFLYLLFIIAFDCTITIFKETKSLFNKFIHNKEKIYEQIIDNFKLHRFIVILISASTTFWLVNSFNINNVVASGIVSLIFAIFDKEHDADAYAASFIGMASGEIFPNFLTFFALTFIFALLYTFSKDIYFTKFGGRSGFIAFTSNFLFMQLLGLPLSTKTTISREHYIPVIIVISISVVVINIIHRHIKRSYALPAFSKLLLES